MRNGKQINPTVVKTTAWLSATGWEHLLLLFFSSGMAALEQNRIDNRVIGYKPCYTFV